jgi:hypothetical protein
VNVVDDVHGPRKVFLWVIPRTAAPGSR